MVYNGKMLCYNTPQARRGSDKTALKKILQIYESEAFLC